MSTFSILSAGIGGLTNGELVAAALFGVGGIVALWWGTRTVTDGYEMWSHEPIEAAAVESASGVVEVTGTAEQLDETIVAPYTETECFAHEYETKVKEHDDVGHDDEDTGPEWRTVDHGSDEVPFVVTDGSGEVAVDPAGSELSMETESITNSTQRRRTEERLDPGETVHVYGHRHDDGLGDESVYIGDGDGANFRIADTSAGRAVARLLAKGALAVVAGIAFVGVVVYILGFA
jgi:hypothetical protein